MRDDAEAMRDQRGVEQCRLGHADHRPAGELSRRRARRCRRSRRSRRRRRRRARPACTCSITPNAPHTSSTWLSIELMPRPGVPPTISVSGAGDRTRRRDHGLGHRGRRVRVHDHDPAHPTRASPRPACAASSSPRMPGAPIATRAAADPGARRLHGVAARRRARPRRRRRTRRPLPCCQSAPRAPTGHLDDVVAAGGEHERAELGALDHYGLRPELAEDGACAQRGRPFRQARPPRPRSA